MKLMIDLLRRKNNHLTQFEKISSFECRRLQAGDASHIDKFYYKRQILLDKIEDIDKRLKKHKSKNLSEEHKKTALKLFQEQRRITHSILQQDMMIHAFLNNAGDDIIEEQIA